RGFPKLATFWRPACGPSSSRSTSLTSTRRAVHIGLFVEEMRQGASQAAAFRDIFDTAERADALGLDCVWLGEIHFTPTRSVISASLQVASAIASRTKRLRVGTAVQVLPPHPPPRLAPQHP